MAQCWFVGVMALIATAPIKPGEIGFNFHTRVISFNQAWPSPIQIRIRDFTFISHML